MNKYDIYQDIAERTGGDIYIGVVGPVRSGKSTFIKKFMEQMVIPNIINHFDRERAQDELPQSGNGRTIMTTEPKFVPGEAVAVKLADNIQFQVRLVDCVGYAVDGAVGYEEDAGPRMVITPWQESPVTFGEAAEMGTQKVIKDHSTIGLVITTDGSITDLPRPAYVTAEERVINELKGLGKPFIVILNSVTPGDDKTLQLAEELQVKYQVPVMPADCLHLNNQLIEKVLLELLYMFPVREMRIDFPNWVEELDQTHWLRAKFEEAVFTAVAEVDRVRDIQNLVDTLKLVPEISEVTLQPMELGQGSVSINVLADRSLFYRILEEISGFVINGDHHLMKIIKELSVAKHEYDKVAGALVQVRETGYGVVQPLSGDIVMDEPELYKHGMKFGVRLKASAPSIHMIKVMIMTEVTPVVGTEKQGEEFVRYLTDEFEKDPSRIWQMDFFGKSMHDLVSEGIQTKLTRMPENAQEKLQETLTKIVNEGSGGLICIIL